MATREQLLAEAEAILGKSGSPVAAAANLTDPGQGDYFQKHPNTFSQETSNPLLAMLGSGAKTGAAVLKGVARSPVDIVKGLPQAPGQVLKGLFHPTEGLPALVSDPSLLKEAPGAAKNAYDYIGANPEEGGSLLGQIALSGLSGKYAPQIADAGVRGTAAVGRGVGKLGDVIERGGQAAIDTKVAGGMGIPGLGALEAVMGNHPVAGVATAAAPYALKYAGKGIGAAGDALASLKRFANDDLWAGDASAVKPDTAAADLLGGQARAYEGPDAPSRPKIPMTPLAEEQSPRDIPVVNKVHGPADYASDIAHIQARGGEVPPALRSLAQPEQGTQSFADAVREQAQQPFFKANAEGAFNGDRTTGSFDEGPSGLTAVSEGRVGTNPAFQHFAGEERPSLQGLEGLKSRWGYQDPAGEPVFTAPPEGASTGIPGEYPPGPAAPGFSVGPKSTLPASTGSPLADAAQRAAQQRFHLKFLKDLAGSAR